MGAALSGRNQVHVAFHDRLTALRQPLDCPVHGFLVAGKAAGKRIQGHGFNIRQRRPQVIPQPALVAPLVFFAGLLLQEGDGQAGAQNGLGPQVMAKPADRKVGAVKVFHVRGELEAGTGVAFTDRVDHFQL